MHDPEEIEFVAVCSPRDATQAGMIRETLEQAGLNCYVDNEMFSAVQMGGMSMGVGGMRVMVPETQADQARDIIAGLGME